MTDGYARYKGYDYDGGERALIPTDDHTCACGESLEYDSRIEPRTLTCTCGVEWSVEAEGGYGDDGSKWRWWITGEAE